MGSLWARGLTPSSGHPPASFAGFRLPLMSNVRRHTHTECPPPGGNYAKRTSIICRPHLPRHRRPLWPGGQLCPFCSIAGLDVGNRWHCSCCGCGPACSSLHPVQPRLPRRRVSRLHCWSGFGCLWFSHVTRSQWPILFRRCSVVGRRIGTHQRTQSHALACARARMCRRVASRNYRPSSICRSRPYAAVPTSAVLCLPIPCTHYAWLGAVVLSRSTSQIEWQSHCCRVERSQECRLTRGSTGRATVGFASFRAPVSRNVRPHKNVLCP
jgi:hypothetical protein